MICFFPVSANKSRPEFRYTVYQIDYALEEVEVGDWMVKGKVRGDDGRRVEVSLRGHLDLY